MTVASHILLAQQGIRPLRQASSRYLNGGSRLRDIQERVDLLVVGVVATVGQGRFRSGTLVPQNPWVRIRSPASPSRYRVGRGRRSARWGTAGHHAGDTWNSSLARASAMVHTRARCTRPIATDLRERIRLARVRKNTISACSGQAARSLQVRRDRASYGLESPGVRLATLSHPCAWP